MDYVNRDDRGYVDFEKMIGLDGIVIINSVSNPSDAALSKKKELQTFISHNDGERDGDKAQRGIDIVFCRWDLEADHTSQGGLSRP